MKEGTFLPGAQSFQDVGEETGPRPADRVHGHEAGYMAGVTNTTRDPTGHSAAASEAGWTAHQSRRSSALYKRAGAAARPESRPVPQLPARIPLPAPAFDMSETAPAAPAAPAPAEKTPVKKKARKSAGAAKRKASGPPVSELITKAVAASKERSGVSLAALKKALAAAGYDVEKNNSRIKLGLKSLVSKGTLVQTKGTGASGSFKLNKKAASGDAKPKAKKAGAAKPKKPAGAAKKPKKATGAATPKKSAKRTPKKAKKPAAAAGAKKAKSPKKAKAAKAKKAPKSPAKAKAVKPKAAKPKTAKPKAAKPKKAAAKKK
ncbi:Histone H1.4 [Galemys pyrenaicus]|uniref:Histone H1.4 n=1 Tax=Galemys pyrenaicus TaxID=202257 RepID=A0A8J6DF40_GALPY|nr:Histone H1.4 [Galemys pyrenaicus]